MMSVQLPTFGKSLKLMKVGPFCLLIGPIDKLVEMFFGSYNKFRVICWLLGCFWTLWYFNEVYFVCLFKWSFTWFILRAYFWRFCSHLVIWRIECYRFIFFWVVWWIKAVFASISVFCWLQLVDNILGTLVALGSFW